MKNCTEDKQSLWRTASPSLPLYINREEWTGFRVFKTDKHSLIELVGNKVVQEAIFKKKETYSKLTNILK